MEEQFHRTQFNDQMTVKHPTRGSEWRLDVMNEQVALRPVIGFKLKRLVPGEFLFMMVKDYLVPPEDVVSAKVLVSEFYPQSYSAPSDDEGMANRAARRALLGPTVREAMK